MTDPTSTAVVSPDPSRSFFGHPRGLATLFMMEFFERFTYYTVRGMLVIFLAASATAANPGFGIDGAAAGAVYGLFAGAAYLGCVPGGWIADRLIGQRNAVFIGGLVIAVANFVLAIPSTPSVFYSGLAIMVIGIGLLKPNVSAIVGSLYQGQPGARRDAGFSIFYMGINLGASIGPLTAGTVGEKWNWHLGFLLCGLATLIGVVQFKFTGKYLGDAGLAPTNVTPEERRKTWAGVVLVAFIGAAGAAALFLGDHVPTKTQLAWGLLVSMALIALVFFTYVLFFAGLDAASRKRVGVIFVFFVCAAMFWAGFEQQGTTFNTFAVVNTDRSWFGSWFPDHAHPAIWYQSLNPIFIILFAPFFAWLWVALGVRNMDPSAPAKMGVGLMLLGVGFLVMFGAASLVVSSNGKVGPEWLLMAYLFHTFGELCLSPVGLSNVTKLSPPSFVGRMMGTWFLGAAIGNTAAGLAGGYFASIDTGQMPSIFMITTLIGGGAGVLILLLSRPLRSWIGDAK